MSKTAIITGSARGIGAAIALRLAKDGFNIALNDVSEKSFENNDIMEKITALGVRCEKYIADVSSHEACEGFVKKVKEDFGSIDVLVNNAGISYVGLLTDMTYQQWREVIDINLSACFLTCRHAVPEMVRRRRGKIINISSVWGSTGASMEVAYSASKGGVNAFTRALAKELAPSNIQVNAVACGVIDTDMNRCFDEEEMRMLIQEIPADRIGRPEEAAELVKLLCTGNEYLTGQVITLDGGWT